MVTTQMPAWLRHHWKRRLNTCCFNHQWKDIYNWVQEIMKKEHLWLAVTQKEGWKHRWEQSHKSQWERQIYLNKSKMFSLPERYQNPIENHGYWSRLGLPHKWTCIIISFPITLWNSMRLHFPIKKLQLKCSEREKRENFHHNYVSPLCGKVNSARSK